MNKYLEKIAEIHEFEPGVRYDTSKHSVKITPDRMNKELDRADKRSRVIGAIGFGTQGLMLGGLSGAALVHSAGRTTSGGTDFKAYGDALRAHNRDNPFSTPLHRQAHETHLEYMNRLNDHTESFLGRPPAPKSEDFRLPQKFVHPNLNKFVRRIGERKLVPAALILGAGGLGTLGYMMSGLREPDKKYLRTDFQGKMEDKHSKHIDRLEGWDD